MRRKDPAAQSREYQTETGSQLQSNPSRTFPFLALRAGTWTIAGRPLYHLCAPRGVSTAVPERCRPCTPKKRLQNGDGYAGGGNAQGSCASGTPFQYCGHRRRRRGRSRWPGGLRCQRAGDHGPRASGPVELTGGLVVSGRVGRGRPCLACAGRRRRLPD